MSTQLKSMSAFWMASIISVCVFASFLPSQASAQVLYTLPSYCSDNNVEYAIQGPIATYFVSCVSSTIRNITYGYVPPGNAGSQPSNFLLLAISQGMAPVVLAISTFVIAIQGIKIMAGESSIKIQTMRLLIRLAAVNFFFFNMGGLAHVPFDIMDELHTDISSAANGGQPYTPWGDIDLLLGLIFGIDPQSGATMPVCPTGIVNCTTPIQVSNTGRSLGNGIVGLMSVSAFSGAPGIMLTLAGVLAFFELISFSLDIIYVYLLAELLLAMCVILSPIIIPLGLFRHTDRYFRQWINTIVGAVLVPALLFGFLALMINLICQPIYDAINYLNPAGYVDPNSPPANPLPDFTPYTRQNQSLFATWAQGRSSSFGRFTDRLANTGDQATNGPTSVISNTPPVPRFMNSKAGSETVVNSSFLGAVNSTSWGLNLVGSTTATANSDVNIRNAMFSLFTLWIYTSILTGMVKLIPNVAQRIAGAGLTLGTQGQSLSQSFSGASSIAKSGSSFISSLGAGTKPPAGSGNANAGGSVMKTLITGRGL